MKCIYLVVKEENGVTKYYSESPSMTYESSFFTSDKRKAKRIKIKEKASKLAKEHNGFVANVPIL